MNAMRYLNTMLTVLALLLALNLWTAWSAAPGMSAQAYGQGIPDEGAQRQQIVDLLKKLNVAMEEQAELLKSGDVQVRVILPDEEGQPAPRPPRRN